MPFVPTSFHRVAPLPQRVAANSFIGAALAASVFCATASAFAASDEPAVPEAADDSQVFENATSLDTELLLNAPVITATGREQSRALAPANVVTWERDELRRHGWTSLADVLANTPGLYVTDDLVLPQVGVRGVTPGLRGGTRIVRIMINGVQVNFRPDLTAFLGQEYIPFETVERIEIAKGPLSSLYGANAFLATVNIITLKPNHGIEGEAQGNVQVINNRGGAGYGARVGFGGAKGHVQLAFTGANYNRSGLKLHKTFTNQDPTSGAFTFFDKDNDATNGSQSNPSQDDRTRPKSLYGSGELKSDTMGQLFVQGGLQLLDSVAEFQPSSVLTHGSRAALRNDWIAANYIYGYGSDYTLSFNAGLSSGAPQGKETLLSTTDSNQFRYTRNFGYTAVDLGGAFEAKLPLKLELKTGVDFTYDRENVLYYSQFNTVQQGSNPIGTRTNRIDPTLPLERTISDVGLYAQLGGNPIAALPNLYVLGNVRYDDPNLFESQVTWRLGLAYQWTERVVSKLFVGRAFQTPSGVQLFASPGYGNAYNIVGNRIIAGSNTLQPQTVFSTELATTVAITNSIVVDNSFYYQEINNQVEFEQITTNFTARNQPVRRYGGGELGLRASSSRINTYVYGSAQASTYTDDRGNSHFGFRAPPELPAFTIYGGTTLRLPEIFAAVDVVARVAGARGASPSNIILNNRERYTLPSYAVLDLNITSLDWLLFSDTAETKLTVSFKNLFDTRYSNPGYGGFDFPSVGRVMFFKLAQAF